MSWRRILLKYLDYLFFSELIVDIFGLSDEDEEFEVSY